MKQQNIHPDITHNILSKKDTVLSNYTISNDQTDIHIHARRKARLCALEPPRRKTTHPNMPRTPSQPTFVPNMDRLRQSKQPIVSSDVEAPPNERRPPDSSTLWCEFVNINNCNATFSAEISWIRHHADHLHNNFPEELVCWFCDDVPFKISEQNPVSPTLNFWRRMQHIHSHIHNEHTTKRHMRPDFHLFQHLREKDQISSKVYDHLIEYNELPPALRLPEDRQNDGMGGDNGNKKEGDQEVPSDDDECITISDESRALFERVAASLQGIPRSTQPHVVSFATESLSGSGGLPISRPHHAKVLPNLSPVGRKLGLRLSSSTLFPEPTVRNTAAL